MAKCQICNNYSRLISSRLGICLNCIRFKPEECLKIGHQIHNRTRQNFKLPAELPRSTDEHALNCGQCANMCVIGEGETGYCGLVDNENGRLFRRGGTAERGALTWYRDPLPTNCVSYWFCPGCTGAGYPKFAYQPRTEIGHSNLAVFYQSCSSDCLFCQNWHYRKVVRKLEHTVSARELAFKVDEKTSCICFFGGDPSTQMPHALATSKIAMEKACDQKRILRICWETNGRMLSKYARQAAELSLETGGNIKFDLKTWNDTLGIVLCGTSNTPTFENFKIVGEKFNKQRPGLPVLTASTLLVPGYVDAEEVENIARFIGEVNSQIPYSLLAFYPAFLLGDLPNTRKKHAIKCYEAAKKHLENVKIGNVHLLS